MQNQKFKKFLYLTSLVLVLLTTSCDTSDTGTDKPSDINKPSEILDNANYACYTIENVDENLKSARVYYPTQNTTNETCLPMQQSIETEYSNRPVMLMTHGWNGTEESFTNQAINFAKMGVVVMAYTTAKHANVINNPSNWVVAFEDMFKSLDREIALEGSPIAGKINMQNINLFAHSMGGGGLFHLFDKHQNLNINTAISVTPWYGSESNYLTKGKVNAKSFLILSGNSDMVAAPAMQEFYYSLLPDNTQTQKALIKLNKMGHLSFGASAGVTELEIADKYFTDWVKLQIYQIDPEATLYNELKIDELKSTDEILTFKSNLF